MVVRVPLLNRHDEIVAHALVDDIDACALNIRWLRTTNGYPGRHRGLLHTWVAERMGILGTKPDIAHVDGDRLNNRRANLRAATRRENMMTLADPLRRDNKSGVRGVWWATRDKVWRAGVRVNGKNIYLGQSRSFDEAVAMRRSWEQENGWV